MAQPFVSYPLTVRAFDQAGNETSHSRSFTVDLEPPTGFYPFSFNHPLGSHLDAFSILQVDWLPVFVTSELVTVTVAIDQNPTTTPTSVVAGQPALPFAANYAVQIDGAASGALWTFNGGGWQSGPLQFAQGDSGGTEVRLPWNIAGVGPVQLLAFALDNDGQLWSAFPTNNSLSEEGWTGSYLWSSLCNTFGPGAWQPAAGDVVWQALINAPGGGALPLEFRATDKVGNQSQIVGVSFVVDAAAPLITPQVPAVITRTVQTLLGLASDPAPAGSRVETVEMQADAVSGLWQPLADPSDPNAGGQRSWSALWSLGLVDGENRQVRFRATDLAGNATTTGWQTALVDNVPPLIEATQLLTRVVVSDYVPGAPTPAPVLTGQATDGSGVNRMAAVVYTPDGETLIQPIAMAGDDWSYRPQFADVNAVTSRYVVRIGAVDAHENTTFSAPFELWVDPAATAAVNAQVAFQAVGVVPAGVEVTVVLSPSVGSLLVYTPTVGLAGEIAREGVPLNTYDVWVKHARHLARRVAGVVVTAAGVFGLNLGELRGGDATNDNAVAGGDFSILAGTYLLGSGDPGYDGRADFNFDQFVAGADFSILSSNYLQAGAPQPPLPMTAGQAEPLSSPPAGVVQLRVQPDTQAVAPNQPFSV